MSARLSGLPAYVSLSKFTISTLCWDVSRCRIKFDPIKPAPPVTRTFTVSLPYVLICQLCLQLLPRAIRCLAHVAAEPHVLGFCSLRIPRPCSWHEATIQTYRRPTTSLPGRCA